ncbi:MAG: hypothetical protein OEW81_13365, partial [Gammaproteobacteria bacterium]|nr:hypothetical protein [Gammaproteobacteria bacterium]
MNKHISLLAILTVTLCVPAGATPMPESERASIRKVVIVPGESPGERAVSGSYEKGAAGLYGGMASGAGASTVYKEVGPVSVNFPIPILQLPGMIFGGIKGSTEKQLQEFRDALTDDLLKASSKPLSNEKIALDVYSDIRTLPGLDARLFAPSTPIPEDSDAIVFVSLQEIGIEVDDDEAIITTIARVTVTRVSDKSDIYVREIRYQDRDTLSNWTANDNAVWRDYTNFARHYIGRELAAEVFHGVALRHTLLPEKSANVSLANKNAWQGSSKTRSPTLSWKLDLLGGEGEPGWAGGIAEADIFYDVEIYDLHKPVYSQQGLADPQHTLSRPLDACETYRWSVRPSYRVNGQIRYGEWMRSNSVSGNGDTGTHAALVPAYLDGFAT